MLNPIVYTERVISDFLKYQITTYPFADPGLCVIWGQNTKGKIKDTCNLQGE